MDGMRGSLGRRVGVALVLALAVSVVGCGDSGGSGSDGADKAEATSSSGDRAQVSDAITELRTIYNKRDGDTFCSRLTPQGRKEVEVMVPKAYPDTKAKDCAGIVKEYSTKIVGGGQPQQPVKVRRVSVDGTKARVVVTGGLAGVRRIVPFRFEKQDGKWLLDDPISGTSRVIGMDYSIRLPGSG
jgi:2,3-bisphosphoglycerate-independent phosphoglycerate mutase